MNPTKSLGVVFGVLLLIFLMLSVFIVDETERAIILRLGKIQENSDGTVKVIEPGLSFRVPFIDSVRRFNKQVRNLEIQSSRIPTEEKKELIIDLYNKWRIVDFDKFFRSTGGNPRQAERLLREKTNDGLRTEIGRRKLNDVVSYDRDLIMQKISQEVNTSAANLGVEVVDARVVRIELPPEVSDAVFNLMRTEREQFAKQSRAQGRSRSEAIRAEADATVTVTLAKADQESRVIRGEGDAEAARIYQESFSQDPEFFRFFRTMEAYRNTFQSNSDILVLKPDSDFFSYFQTKEGRSSRSENS